MEPLEKILSNIKKVIIGKDEAIKQVLAALLAHGHILIEDVPGVGKTFLARALACSLNAEFKRVQFTPDLLPSDITGTSVFNEQSREFEFRAGPVFANILLADEINRATPRTQASLLESMEERQATVDGKTHPLPTLFFVIATQNPIEQQGVYRLPEAQLDRFLMQISLGYPEQQQEILIMDEQQFRHPLETLEPVAELHDVLEAQEEIKHVHVEQSLKQYLVQIVSATRQHREVLLGASPRASLAMIRAAQALAYLEHEEYVRPDLIKQLAKPVLRHRLILRPQARLGGINADLVIEEILRSHEVPVREYE